MRTRTTKSQRALTRRSGGPLKTVQDKTRALYDMSLQCFVHWALQTACWPEIKEELDSAVCQFILAAWQEGETRALVANLISGISDAEPSLRNYLAGARRLHMAWIKRELGGRCCPIPWWMARAIAGMLLHWSYVEDCTMVLLGHHGLLRTNEYLNCHSGDFVINDLMKKGHMSLPDTKNSTRHGRSESVTMKHW